MGPGHAAAGQVGHRQQKAPEDGDNAEADRHREPCAGALPRAWPESHLPDGIAPEQLAMPREVFGCGRAGHARLLALLATDYRSFLTPTLRKFSNELVRP